MKITVAKDTAKTKGSNSSRSIWLGAITVFLLLLALFSWHGPQKSVPSDLVGEWRTTDSNFSDRWFDIDSVLIDFGTGGATVSTGFIKEVKSVPDGNRTLYTISYSVDGVPNEVSFYHDTSDGTIRFLHQENIIWKKQE